MWKDGETVTIPGEGKQNPTAPGQKSLAEEAISEDLDLADIPLEALPL